MIVTVKNLNEVLSLMEPYLPIVGLDLCAWLENDKNVVLRCDDDLAFFENVRGQVYEGHYFFKSRGRLAKQRALGFLEKFFQSTDSEIIQGLTPLENLGARWLSRQLGFKSYGVVQTVVGPCELFILTKEDWENKINE